MATVKMLQIKSTVSKALAYISRADATSDGVWVSTNAAVIDPTDYKAVATQFAETAERVGVSKQRRGSVLAHHVIQSFDPKDGMSAELAHRIGVQFAEKITGGTHEYMIATHLDKGHVHNHIILNPVNFETGKKIRVQKSTIGHFRDISDELCLAAGLRVLPKPERATGYSMRDIYRVLKGDSAKQFIRTEIDKAASRARDWTEFESILARAGIETSVRSGKNGTVSFREGTMNRPIRDFRLGAAYTESNIMARLSKSAVNMVGIDASMILKESKDTLTVSVPGTRRQLEMTVSKTQIVRHGRSLRIYVPSAQNHLLANTSGQHAKTVSTEGLYSYFSKPDLAEAEKRAGAMGLDKMTVGRWGNELKSLRELGERVNAKTRWINASGIDPAQAIESASKKLEEHHFRYQTTLVAAAEMTIDPQGDQKELRTLGAELRIMERNIATVKTDIRALTQLSSNEVKMSVGEQIANKAAARQRIEPASEHSALDISQRSARDDHERDRETPEHRAEIAQEHAAQTERLEDQQGDRETGQKPKDEPKKPLSLRERLAAKEAKIRSNRTNDEGRNDGVRGRGM
ncbi:relaxase/mobilization nuclease domain-containing protein [Glutamicibacter sp.]|uniref:relaxase/mobilization nuclease domain-containing protein n=1 Tax=Glutamicibacter sp. TaxID=1931995 RepID=UPI003D6BD172